MQEFENFKMIWPRSAGTWGKPRNSPGCLDQDLVLLTLQHLKVHDDDLETEGTGELRPAVHTCSTAGVSHSPCVGA